jgi:hypothetical protein
MDRLKALHRVPSRPLPEQTSQYSSQPSQMVATHCEDVDPGWKMGDRLLRSAFEARPEEDPKSKYFRCHGLLPDERPAAQHSLRALIAHGRRLVETGFRRQCSCEASDDDGGLPLLLVRHACWYVETVLSPAMESVWSLRRRTPAFTDLPPSPTDINSDN